MIQCLILEDELAAREVLRMYMEKTPFLNNLGMFESGLDISQDLLQRSDILFLDIQLPDLMGLSYLKTISNPPKVIITSAYPDYAVDAFEENILDYLVKPYSYDRFFKAVVRARNQIQMERKELDKQVFLYADKTLYKFTVDDILFLKAEVDYVSVVTTEKTIMVLDSLRNWEDKLFHFNFIRTHRSYIVNADKIEKVSGHQVFIAHVAIPIGQVYKKDFYKRIGHPLH